MIGIVGLLLIFVMVFGGYIAAGGKLPIILHALPYEMAMIVGAALGAFAISNDVSGVKHTIKDIGKVFKGSKWKQSDYQDLLCLLFELIRLGRQNPMALEEHVEGPDTSAIFTKFPKIQQDRETVDLICDTLRSALMNYDDPNQVEEVLEKRMERNFQHALHSSHALQTIADGLPALGIVAAVLGIIKTMASIDQPPEILGKLIGGALVGTFLGVFLAYGIVGPFAAKVKAVEQQVRTNDLLAGLQHLMGGASAANITSWIGLDVRVTEDAQFSGSPVDIYVAPTSQADRADLVVQDSTGAVIQRIPVPLEASVMPWAGTTESGGPLPNGSYSFTVESFEGDQLTHSAQAPIYRTVTEARIEGEITLLVLDDGTVLPSDQITAIRGGQN